MHQRLIHIRGVQFPGFSVLPGVYEIICATLFYRLHKGLRDTHGDIEVIQFFIVLLAADEFRNIRMIHPEDGHVGASPCPTLLDLLSRRIEYFHERNRS